MPTLWHVRRLDLSRLRTSHPAEPHVAGHATGIYDAINWPGFPDEGYRVYFDADRRSHLTIRPSGTSNALRFHVQLFGGHPSPKDLIEKKAQLRARARRIVQDIRDRIGAREML